MTDLADTKPQPTKTERVKKLLARKAGVDLAALQEATGWQPQSIRAAVSTLRKAGYTIDRLPPRSDKGGAVYRISGQPAIKP